MKQTCTICGKELDENEMVSLFVGRKKWFCWPCYKNGQYEAAKNEIRRTDALRRQMGQKRSLNYGRKRIENR